MQKRAVWWPAPFLEPACVRTLKHPPPGPRGTAESAVFPGPGCGELCVPLPRTRCEARETGRFGIIPHSSLPSPPKPHFVRRSSPPHRPMAGPRPPPRRPPGDAAHFRWVSGLLAKPLSTSELMRHFQAPSPVCRGPTRKAAASSAAAMAAASLPGHQWPVLRLQLCRRHPPCVGWGRCPRRHLWGFASPARQADGHPPKHRASPSSTVCTICTDCTFCAACLGKKIFPD